IDEEPVIAQSATDPTTGATVAM
ncbi:MAG: hypothetical protein QOD27_2100, partial [Microbacteriaceae bacterium]|nr:hypothetical protein [Microbacteriaceae bacterium]